MIYWNAEDRFVPITHGSRRGLFSVATLRLFVVLCALGSLASRPQLQAATLKTQNVFLIITDGFRWQEVFTGAEEQLMTKETGGVKATNELRKAFWRDTAEARREALLPFFWSEIGRRGQIFGNQTKGSVVTV